MRRDPRLRAVAAATVCISCMGMAALTADAVADVVAPAARGTVAVVAMNDVSPTALGTRNLSVASRLRLPPQTPPTLQTVAFGGKAVRRASPLTGGVAPFSAQAWEQSRLGYDLDAVRAGARAVPAVFSSRLPANLGQGTDVAARKARFIRMVLPLVLETNARLVAKRLRLLELQAVRRLGFDLTDAQSGWLQELAQDYRVGAGTPAEQIRELLMKVDVIPPSLAMAQAITESGWGRSRFARKGNALFGQRTWTSGGGIVPKERGADEVYEVQAFRSLLQSVRSYMKNLNTHPAYQDLREARAEMRRDGLVVDGWVLAGGLTRYAETGQEYVEVLRNLIRVNGLRDFDTARLEGAQLDILPPRAF